MAIQVRRFALKYDPPTLIVEYRKHNENSSQGGEKQYTFTKKIRIKKLSQNNDLNIEELADQLITTYPEVLGEDKVKRPQIVALLVKLVAGRGPQPQSQPQSQPPPKPQLNIDLDDELDIDALLNDSEDSPAGLMLPPPALSPTLTTTMFFGKKKGFDPSNGGTANGTFRKDPYEEPDMKAVIASTDLSRCSNEVNRKAKAFMSHEFEANQLRPGDNGYEWDKQVEFTGPTETTDWDSGEESD
jgi:hypothetical protein